VTRDGRAHRLFEGIELEAAASHGRISPRNGPFDKAPVPM
jgi:hypothetical protein